MTSRGPAVGEPRGVAAVGGAVVFLVVYAWPDPRTRAPPRCAWRARRQLRDLVAFAARLRRPGGLARRRAATSGGTCSTWPSSRCRSSGRCGCYGSCCCCARSTGGPRRRSAGASRLRQRRRGDPDRLCVAGRARRRTRTPGSNINSYGNALWWSVSTVTTVGYGDHLPITSEGRAVAIGLMIGGIALIGAVTATLASWLVDRVRDIQETPSRTWRRCTPRWPRCAGRSGH